LEQALEKKLLIALIFSVGIIIGGIIVLLTTKPGTVVLNCDQMRAIASAVHAGTINLTLTP